MRKKRVVSNENISTRHTKRRKKQKQIIRARRCIILLIVVLIAVISFMFFSPVFNIKGAVVYGNNKVLTDTITSQSGIQVGENLFKLNIEQVKKSISSIAYLDKINIKRVIYPASIKIEVTECKPSAYIKIDQGNLLIDKNSKALEVVENISMGLPEIKGINLQKYSLGEKIEIDESDKFDIILLCLNEMEKQNIINKIGNISIDDINNITFVFDNRLTARCGSMIDLDKKILLFNEVIQSDKLSSNSRGTIDLSVSGKAIYTP